MKAKEKKPMGRPKKDRWSPQVLIKVYELAKSGSTDSEIVKVLGIDHRVWNNWLRKKENLQMMLDEGRKSHEENMEGNIKDYVYKKLSPRARKAWDDIVEFHKFDDDEGIARTLISFGKNIRQQLFINALIKFDFNTSEACSFVNISDQTYRQWVKNDPDFAALTQEMLVHKGNLFESALIKLVRNGDSAATIFANKTFNRNRGYGDKTSLTVNGEVEHKHSIEDLDLPVELRRQVLEAIRTKRMALEDKTGTVIDAEFEEKHAEPSRRD